MLYVPNTNPPSANMYVYTYECVCLVGISRKP